MQHGVHSATEEHDAPLAALMERLKLPIPSAWWGRAFAAEAPEIVRSEPFVYVTAEGAVTAFACARPLALRRGDDYIPSTLLHDMFAEDTEDGRRDFDLLLDTLSKRAPLTVAAGPSSHIARALERNHWFPAGTFARYVLKATSFGDPRRYASPPPMLPREQAEDLLAQRGFIFASKTAHAQHWQCTAPEIPSPTLMVFGDSEMLVAGQYALASGHSPAVGTRKELHLIDFSFDPADPVAFFRRLARASLESECDTYLSFFSPIAQSAAAEAGWEPLPPRWALYWFAGTTAGRSLGEVMRDERKWMLTPQDVELDRF